MFRMLLIAVSLAACTPDDGIPRSILTEQEATERTDEMLTALADGDYATYVEHFSDDMLAVVDEEVFDEVRAIVTEASGTYERIEAVEQRDAETAGYTIWSFDTTFTKEPVTVDVVYPDDGDVIEGLHFFSENLQ